MAAVIQLRTAPALDPRQGHPIPGSIGPQLSLIHGGRSARARRLRRTFLLRRAVVLAIAVTVVWVLAQLLGAVFATPAGSSGTPVGATAPAVHQVRSGDTLWALATRVDPDADPRDVVDRIIALNEVGTPGAPLGPDLELRVGTQLRLPAGG